MDMKVKNSLLIVDDDNTNLIMLSHILKPEYSVRIALNGESALKIADKYVPDLILMDIIMPGMDGYQVFEELQKSEKTAHIPVIFITGLNNIDDEKKGLILGAVDYISKPFDDMIVKLRIQHQIRIINQLRTIENLSMIDQMTGIPNRRNFDSRLRAEWSSSIRDGHPISILMVDVDHFKIYNDTYGHQQGDRALQAVAGILTGTLKRGTDFTARWGGEEFVVLLPYTDLTGSLKISEQIRINLESAEIPCSDGKITRITASIGLNAYKAKQECSIDEFISRADRALYEAKNTGRNKVVFYE